VFPRISIKDNMILHMRECNTSNRHGKHHRVLSLKCNIFSIKIEENESIRDFISRIKGKLGNIGKKVFSIDVVTINLDGILEDYQMFIIGLEERVKALTFKELAEVYLCGRKKGERNLIKGLKVLI
jgi:hypothetical protein